ncbi:MAG: DUF4349 domain-containing protein, partial [Pirellulales bacterium]|nr:DUF4349 domain-containing protein [Pirellulales bacterium]
TRVRELVAEHNGYIAGNSLSAESGSDRSGSWKLRVPTDQFEAFMEEAKALGEIIEYNVTSREVTDEYFDIQARSKNKQVERDRMQAILENKVLVAKLQDVLEVERELSRVQGEIERFQGRIRQLDDLVAMTTINLKIRQIVDYVPPEAVGFATLARRSFDRSFAALTHSVQSVALAGVALAPWLPVFLVTAIVMRFAWKRFRPAPQ